MKERLDRLHLGRHAAADVLRPDHERAASGIRGPSREHAKDASRALLRGPARVRSGWPRECPFEGLAAAGYFTNATVFNLTERPRRLLVVGGGPLGCELAQAFARLGSEVIIAGREPHFLPGEERDAAEVLADALHRDGIDVRLNTKSQGRQPTRRREARAPGQRQPGIDGGGGSDSRRVGRVPNVEGLNLEAAGVDYNHEHGVRVNDYLQTSNRRAYPRGTPKTSQSGTPENQPVVKGKADVDSAWAERLPRGDGQRLETREARTGACAGAAWLVAAADPA